MRLKRPDAEAALMLQGTSFTNFMKDIKADATKKVYEDSLVRYCKYLKITSIDNLLQSPNQKIIESQIMDYIKSLKESGVAYSTIKFLVAPVFTFYQLNDVVLNRKRVLKRLPEFKRVVKDEAYTTEQIQQMLQTADARMRMIILLLVSTGCRIGALPSLTLGNLTKIPDYNLYKVVFYEGYNSEHHSYATRECSITGIDNYLNFRKRCGEKLSFDENTNKWKPADAPLIRLQFDMNDVLQARNPQPIKLEGLRMALYYHLIKSGIRQVEHLTENGSNRIRKPVAFANGFRKFTITSFARAKMSYEIRQYLVDHKGGYLDKEYLRMKEDEMLQEYLKAEVEYLTIDPSMRLKQELAISRAEVSEIRTALEDLNKVKEHLGLT